MNAKTTAPESWYPNAADRTGQTDDERIKDITHPTTTRPRVNNKNLPTLLWPSSVRTHEPSARLQILAVASHDAVTANWCPVSSQMHALSPDTACARAQENTQAHTQTTTKTTTTTTATTTTRETQ